MIAGGFVIACFVAFHRMRVERDDAIKSLSANRPDFKAQIETIVIGEAPAAVGGGGNITVKMTIANRGAAGIARNFSAWLRLPDGKLVRGELWWTKGGPL